MAVGAEQVRVTNLGFVFRSRPRVVFVRLQVRGVPRAYRRGLSKRRGGETVAFGVAHCRAFAKRDVDVRVVVMQRHN